MISLQNSVNIHSQASSNSFVPPPAPNTRPSTPARDPPPMKLPPLTLDSPFLTPGEVFSVLTDALQPPSTACPSARPGPSADMSTSGPCASNLSLSDDGSDYPCSPDFLSRIGSRLEPLHLSSSFDDSHDPSFDGSYDSSYDGCMPTTPPGGSSVGSYRRHRTPAMPCPPPAAQLAAEAAAAAAEARAKTEAEGRDEADTCAEQVIVGRAPLSPVPLSRPLPIPWSVPKPAPKPTPRPASRPASRLMSRANAHSQFAQAYGYGHGHGYGPSSRAVSVSASTSAHCTPQRAPPMREQQQQPQSQQHQTAAAARGSVSARTSVCGRVGAYGQARAYGNTNVYGYTNSYGYTYGPSGLSSPPQPSYCNPKERVIAYPTSSTASAAAIAAAAADAEESKSPCVSLPVAPAPAAEKAPMLSPVPGLRAQQRCSPTILSVLAASRAVSRTSYVSPSAPAPAPAELTTEHKAVRVTRSGSLGMQRKRGPSGSGSIHVPRPRASSSKSEDDSDVGDDRGVPASQRPELGWWDCASSDDDGPEGSARSCDEGNPDVNLDDSLPFVM